MLDLRLIREKTEEIQERLQRRDPKIDLREILNLDQRRRKLIVEVEGLKKERNLISKKIGEIKRKGGDIEDYLKEMRQVAGRIKELDHRVRELNQRLKILLSHLPNLPHPSVPVSQDKNDKVVEREWGKKPEFNFSIKNHLELGKDLGILDFGRAARMAASQFPLYVRMGARLEWALINFMLDVQVNEKGYIPVIPPYLVNARSVFSSGNLPKFGDELYQCQDELYLIPTSEVPLGNLHQDEILKEEDLPLCYTAYSACFRREAGTYGAGERGLIRIHQFNKVELYKYTTPQTSYDELEGLITDAEDIVKRLGLHYRVTTLVTGDIAQQSAKTCDVEAWLPAQGEYYEVSSCSNCEDFQARRGNIRYRPNHGGRPQFVHTLNGSGLATSRLMVAILETFQQKDGSVIIPKVLRPYLKGTEIMRG